MVKRLFTIVFFCCLALSLLCLGALGISIISNRNLPLQSQVTDRLSTLEKARLAEAIQLKRILGNLVWPDWGKQDIPFIVYNEEYAFLVNYPKREVPPDGWLKMPQQVKRGGPWELVPGDVFQGQVYYRQRLLDPAITPENFTVLVDDHWVATMETKEYMEVAFYDDYRQELPPFLQTVFPYRIFWGMLMGETDTYLGGLEHEGFHSFQGSLAPERLEQAEVANRSETAYPWDDAAFGEAWVQEAGLLVEAVNAHTDAEAAGLARWFLETRDARRTNSALGSDLVDYERQREWLEGLAKYAELELTRIAGETPSYLPVSGLASDPDFKEYATRVRFWSQQLDEAKRSAGRVGETRFYYCGFAQAALLDRLLPGWKKQAFEPGVMLEDLLRVAVQRQWE
jgi:hypothetical protein